MTRSYASSVSTLKQLVFAASVVMLTMLSVASAFAQPQNRRTEAPLIEDADGRFLVRARINGLGPFELIIDTAATRTAIFEKTRAVLEIEKNTTTMATVLTPFGTERLPVTAPLRMDVTGGRTMTDLRAVILPDWTDEFGPDGFLGLDFLASYFVLFDLRNNLFEIYDRNPQNLPENWVRVGMEAEKFGDIDEPLYWVNLRLGRRRFYTVFDTGSVSSIINWSAARRLGLDPDSPDFSGGTMEDALGNERPVVGLRFQRVRLGRKLWRNQVVLVADMKIFEAFGRKEEPTGILGLDLMKQQNFAVDFAAKQLIIAPLSRSPSPGSIGRRRN